MIALLLGSHIFASTLLSDSAEVKPALKGTHAGEDVWQQEVEKTPKLAQIVLQRGAYAGDLIQ